MISTNRRRLTDHASPASVDAVLHSRHRTAAGRTNDRTVRSRLLFVLFFPQRKEHASPFQRRKYVLFSAGRKDTKRAVEATASNSHPSAEKRIHTGSQQTEPRTCVHSPSFAVREVIAAGKSAPAGARVPGLHSPPVRRVPPWIARVYECKHVSLPCIFLKIHRTESKE